MRLGDVRASSKGQGVYLLVEELPEEPARYLVHGFRVLVLDEADVKGMPPPGETWEVSSEWLLKHTSPLP